MTARTLNPGQLARRCDPATLGFATTAELADLDEVVGQTRATEAVRFAIAMPDDGYHVYLMGPPGSGKRAIAQRAIRAQRAGARKPRGDWAYVNNFARPHQPLALRLPPGRGSELREDMRRLVQDLQTLIPAVFESEEYTAQVERIGAEIGERANRALQEVGQGGATARVGAARRKRRRAAGRGASVHAPAVARGGRVDAVRPR
ncbi:MAG: AAA family ATPase [Burkholderiaceae bacterium]|nr:AAA family ATPase [Burkholderiaceae bacterium]MCX8114820.1 AAA family ATPase [Burkholderiaceae bacterium]